MARYDSEWDNQNQMNMNRSRDLVLSMNEFCFLQSKTNGAIMMENNIFHQFFLLILKKVL